LAGPTCAAATVSKETAMEYIIAAVIAVAIGVYLIYALLRPERF
jgi:K+-transporting ATPase KdpF subunit